MFDDFDRFRKALATPRLKTADTVSAWAWRKLERSSLRRSSRPRTEKALMRTRGSTHRHGLEHEKHKGTTESEPPGRFESSREMAPSHAMNERSCCCRAPRGLRSTQHYRDRHRIDVANHVLPSRNGRGVTPPSRPVERNERGIRVYSPGFRSDATGFDSD
jgi:hypothetical protein